MDKLHLSLPVVVEGKYDKIKLDSILEGTVLTTEGFGIFKSSERTALLRRIAQGGIIVLTDADGGGRQIRSYLSSILPKDKVIHLYTPAVHGKEKRKKHPSRAGLLGVEGTDADTLRALLLPFCSEGEGRKTGGVEKRDLYLDGLSGTSFASERRRSLCERLSLPPDMTPNALLAAINLFYTRDEYKAIVDTL